MKMLDLFCGTQGLKNKTERARISEQLSQHICKGEDNGTD